MDKLKAILKTIILGVIMLAFILSSSFIAKALKLSDARTYLFQGGFILLGIIVPILYCCSKNCVYSDFGFNKQTKKEFKTLLFYIPLILCLIPLIALFDKSGSKKIMLMSLFYYGCVALSTELYFRGAIQKILRGKTHIVFTFIYTAALLAACCAFYVNHITSYKQILVLIMGLAGLSGVLCVVIENKGNIIITGIIEWLFLFFATHIAGGKRMLLGIGLSCVVLLAYGLFILFKYLKEHKPERKIESFEVNLENNENDGFDENDNIDLTSHD